MARKRHPDQPWKKAERRLARFFGSERRPLSGGNQGTGLRDDGMHEALHLESKYSAYTPLFTLYRETRNKANAEDRTPVIGLFEKAKPGMLLCIHSSDFEQVVIEWAKANGMKLVRTLGRTVSEVRQ